MPDKDPHPSDPPQDASEDSTRRLSSEPSDVKPADDVSEFIPVSDDTTPWASGDEVSETIHPPSMPKPVNPAKSTGKFGDRLPEVGEVIEDFELIQELGRGAMGVVFLAKQISLGRQVALKVSKNIGDEAQTMASMEHRHIVQVFSESIISGGDQRLLCMQFVPGVTLEKVIKSLREHSNTPMTGRRFIDIIDDAQRGPALLDPEALHDRLMLSESTREEVVCRIGIWLSEALEYAHRRGVLHRDIKPANILVDPYGHPRLADFSLSARSAEDEEDAGDALFGGTINYMAPEHLLAFVHEMDEEDVDERADIYGLGLVLYELLTLYLPTVPRDPDMSMHDHVHRLVEFRLETPESIRDRVPEASAALDRTMSRCLDPDPACRIGSAAELAGALRGCLELKQTERALPPQGRLLSWFERSPIWSIVAFTLLPHIAGSVVNITYNLWIVHRFLIDQAGTFNWLVVAYNLIVYPGCTIAVIKLIVLPALRFKRALEDPSQAANIDIDEARRTALKWPLWAALLASIGWFPGIVFFPMGIQIFDPPMLMEPTANFFMSIAISGLIALTYSMVGLQLVSLRYYYPQLWNQAERLHETAREELSSSRKLLGRTRLLAGSIPALGACAFVMVQNKQMDDWPFRVSQILTLCLIFLSIGGYQIAGMVRDKLEKTIDALTGTEPEMK